MRRFVQSIALYCLAAVAGAAPSTLEPVRGYAWSETTGYLNAGDGGYGLVVKRDWLEGYAWSPAIGWIFFGAGPDDGVAYAIGDGVNRSRVSGYLAGFAWSENAGWINFGSQEWEAVATTRPRMNDAGVFSGLAWSENLGWINLSALCRAPDNEWDGLKDSLDPDDDNDLLPDTVDTLVFDPANGRADDDGDGADNGSEFFAGTDASDPSSVFRVSRTLSESSGFAIRWNSVPGKTYQVLRTFDLNQAFAPLGDPILADEGYTEVLQPWSVDHAFYRIQVLAE